MALENNGIPIVTLIYVNSAMNPVLYTILSHNFRSKCQFVRRRIQRVYRTQKRNSHAVLMLSGHKVSSVKVTTAYSILWIKFCFYHFGNTAKVTNSQRYNYGNSRIWNTKLKGFSQFNSINYSLLGETMLHGKCFPWKAKSAR